ncbi:uncharacterized protein DS421_15g500680 [Arachis hypogaea]|nr:uncharacterized protein DS421_15g500680 [Arachis hypogaea]
MPGYCFLFSGFRFAPNDNAYTQEMTNVIKLICTLYGTLIILPLGRYLTIEWVGGSSRCWRMLHQRLTNRANMVSARSSKYTGGSATFMKTNARLSKLLDREATLAETFKYTHTLKENKARFTDQRPQLSSLSKVGRMPSMTLQLQSSIPMLFGERLAQRRTRIAYTGWGCSSPTPFAPQRWGRHQALPLASRRAQGRHGFESAGAGAST